MSSANNVPNGKTHVGQSPCTLCFLSLLLSLLALTQYMSLISYMYGSVGERPTTSMAPQILANRNRQHIEGVHPMQY